MDGLLDGTSDRRNRSPSPQKFVLVRANIDIAPQMVKDQAKQTRHSRCDILYPCAELARYVLHCSFGRYKLRPPRGVSSLPFCLGLNSADMTRD